MEEAFHCESDVRGDEIKMLVQMEQGRAVLARHCCDQYVGGGQCQASEAEIECQSSTRLPRHEIDGKLREGR